MSATQFKNTLQKPYDRTLFATDVLNRIFGSRFAFYPIATAPETLTDTDKKVIQSVVTFGLITLDDGAQVNCYEILLTPSVRIEQSRVAIQRFVRKMLFTGEAALINFVSPNHKNTWRLTFIAKSSLLTEGGTIDTTTHAKRYTYLLGTAETCKTAAERLEILQNAPSQDIKALTDTFSVEKLGKAFFDEYNVHYKKFVAYLTNANFKQTIFNNDEKLIRDFSKKLLGRLVFLYFVQKKGWLGASDTQYKDGNLQFIKTLFLQAGGGEGFYYNWLSVLFFDTLNAKRSADNFTMPDGTSVKISYLNGGLFDKEKIDNAVLTFNPALFHNALNPDDPKTRGFLDFLDAFNFTVFEDSPDEQTVAVDPEMLGHIFENLLEDNKDKGAFYTPKEIVHYMCQESLIEYLTTHLSKEFTVYVPFGQAQVELFGNDTQQGQLKMIEEIGDKALNRDDVAQIVKQKDIAQLTSKQLNRIGQLLDTVKICDPAIGSGAFPMGLLHEIFAIKEVIAYETGATWQPAKVKQNIIQNSIYGVDIEQGAVDIARLRFWLSLVVDEDTPQPLPNLDYKIVVGNSLVSKFEEEIIDIDWNIKEGTQGNLFGSDNDENRKTLLQNISKKQRGYFNAESNDKKRFALDIRNLKIDLLINQLELMIKTQGVDKIVEGGKKAKIQAEKFLHTEGWRKNIQKLNDLKKHTDKPLQHFDWKLDFPEILNPFFGNDNLGFDIVIGNPPYVQLQKLLNSEKIYGNAGFETYSKSSDIYCLFYEKGVILLRRCGILAYITSNSWLQTKYGASLRKFLREKTDPSVLLNFEDTQLFTTATVEANILLAKRQPFTGKLQAVAMQSDLLKTSISEYAERKKMILNSLDDNGWNVANATTYQIKTAIEEGSIMLKDFGNEFYRGITSGLNEAFFIDLPTKFEIVRESSKSEQIIYKALRGRNIGKYSIHYDNLWLINTFNGYLIPNKEIIEENGEKYFKIDGVQIKIWREEARGLTRKRVNRVISEIDYPSIYNHLLKNHYALEKRDDKGEHWTNLRNCSYEHYFSKEKIVWGRISDKPNFALDTEGYHLFDTLFFMIGKNLKYLISILNSKLGEWYFNQISTSTGMGTNQWLKYKVEQLPIKQVTKTEQKPFEVLVDYLIYLKIHPQTAPANVAPPNFDKFSNFVKVMENVIDGMVCELYFEEEMTSKGIDIIGIVSEDLAALPDFAPLSTEAKQAQIESLYRKWTAPASELNNRLSLMTVRSPDVLGVILGGK